MEKSKAILKLHPFIPLMKRKDEWMDAGWMDRCIDGLNGWMNKWMHGWVSGWIDGRVHGWLAGGRERQIMDGRMEEGDSKKQGI